MIGYTTLGETDLERATAFYDAVLAPLGGRRTLTYERSQYYGGPGRQFASSGGKASGGNAAAGSGFELTGHWP